VLAELAGALRRAEAAHGKHEKRTGQRDADWPNWYSEYMARNRPASLCPHEQRLRHVVIEGEKAMILLIKTLAAVAAGAVLATSAFTQSAKEIRGA
jgi:hypothetical protein